MLVNHFLEETAAATPEKVAIISEGNRVTYGDLNARANVLRDHLLNLGIQKEDRVAIHLGNSLEAIVAVFSVLKAGAVFVFLNELLKPRKLKAIFNNSEAAAVLTDSAVGLRCADDAQSVRFTILGKAVTHPKIHNLAKPSFRLQILLDEETSPAPALADQPAEQDVCGLIYTSGSTGTPKGVTLSHRNMVAASTSILEYLKISSTDTVLNLLPLSSDYGLYNVLMPIRRGSRVVLAQPFLHPNQLVSALNKEGVTGLPLTPTIIAILRRYRRLGIRRSEEVRWITSTGQTLSPALSRWLKITFPAARVFSMYGLTECKRVSYLPPEELDARPTSVGKAIPHTSVHLVNAKGITIRQPGEIGELVVRGPHVMQGYWNLPAETEQALDTESSRPDRLLHTGDLFRTDNEGYLYFIGRKDSQIKSGGYLVSPREVEDVVYELEGVCEVAAVGIMHEVLGQTLRLIAVLDDKYGVTKEKIRVHCQKHLERYEVPKEIEIRRSLPRTAAGKVDYLSLAGEQKDRSLGATT